MNRLRIVLATVFAASAIALVAPPASAGLWCDPADEVDESITVGSEGGPSAGSACRTALGAVCTVVTKDPGCLQ